MTLEFLNPSQNFLLDPGIDNVAIEKSLRYFPFQIIIWSYIINSIEEMELLGIRMDRRVIIMNSKAAEEDNNGRINITNYRLTHIGRYTR